MWQVGQQIHGGKYTILSELGEGGFGLTYKALQVSLGREVVIKTLNRKYQRDPNADKHIERFRKEARQLAKLPGSPYIVKVIDYFDEGGLPCVVMEFVAGKTLFKVVQERGRLPEAEAVKYFRQVALGLQVIHGAGMVHRDVHPGNIMVQPSGEVVLIDFGLATDIVPTTMSSQHFGNMSFAPYEQMLGEREPTVDIYSLSASLYFAVTGQCAEKAWNRRIAVKEKGKSDPFVPPNQFVQISSELEGLICKGMELEAKDRQKNIEQLLSVLNSEKKPKPSVLTSEEMEVFQLFAAESNSEKKAEIPIQKPIPKSTQRTPAKLRRSSQPSSKPSTYILWAVGLVSLGYVVNQHIFSFIPSSILPSSTSSSILPIVEEEVSPASAQPSYPVNVEGLWAISTQFDDAQSFSGELAAVEINEKWGYINTEGEIVIEPQFDYAGWFVEGLAVIGIGGKYGYINTEGEIVIEPQFNDAAIFSEQLARVNINEKWGYINTKGNIVIPPQFDDAWDFSEGLAVIKMGEKWGYINTKGDIVVQPQFDSAGYFSEGLAIVELSIDHGSIRYGYINTEGKMVIEPQFSSVSRFSEGLAWVTTVNEKRGFINTNGEVVIEPQFDWASPFSEGLANVQINDKWGFIHNPFQTP